MPRASAPPSLERCKPQAAPASPPPVPPPAARLPAALECAPSAPVPFASARCTASRCSRACALLCARVALRQRVAPWLACRLAPWLACVSAQHPGWPASTPSTLAGLRQRLAPCIASLHSVRACLCRACTRKPMAALGRPWPLLAMPVLRGYGLFAPYPCPAPMA
eukprot:364184-Chlamydomonas_euryale.AAC.2